MRSTEITHILGCRDDDYITETRYLQQPEGMTSVITGFNASIRIHCRESDEAPSVPIDR